MKTEIRKEGTKVFLTDCANDVITALRQIVKDKQYAIIDDQAVDGFTASAIVQVYDSLNETNKRNYVECHLSRMSDIAFQLINKRKAA